MKYLQLLQKSIYDFIKFLSKRYQLIPWNKIYKVHKVNLSDDIRATIGENKFTIEELITEVKRIQRSLKIKQKEKYYQIYINGFLKDSRHESNLEVKKIYIIYDNKLDDEFKTTKQDLAFCLSAIKEINKILKEDNYKKESEDLTMDFYNEEFFEMGVSKSELQDLIIDTYESLFADDYFDDDLDEVTEGANSEYRKYLKDTKKIYKESMKKIKKYIKDEEYAKAKNEIANANKIIEHSKKWINDNIDSLPEKAIGELIAYGEAFGKGLLISSLALVPVVGTISAVILQIRELIKNGMELYQGKEAMKKKFMNDSNEIDSTQYLNFYKVKIIGLFTEYQRKLKVMEQKIDEAMRDQRKRLNVIAKENALTEASEKFEEQRMMLYEAYQNGDITLAERESLLSELKNDLFFTETTVDVYEDAEDDYMSNTEKFDSIKLALYEKCNDGEITIEERESLINKAYDMFMNEASVMPESKGAKLAGAAATKVQDKLMDATEKLVTKGVQKAGEIAAKNNANIDK